MIRKKVMPNTPVVGREEGKLGSVGQVWSGLGLEAGQMGGNVPWVCSMGPLHRSQNPEMAKADP